MVDILPFRRTALLISETDDFIDKVSEAAMVLERTFHRYLQDGPSDYLDERFDEIVAIEERADELRRNVSKVMYTEMLMPDTRGDVMTLVAEVDAILDNCVHLLVSLSIERPEIPPEVRDGFKEIMTEVTRAVDAMLCGARAYFKEPHAVRDHVHKTEFHDREARKATLATGRQVFTSDLPLERKRQLRDWLREIRRLGSQANDIGDRLTILAVKRAL